MTEKNKKRKPFFANINEDEFDLLTRFEGKYLIRVRAFCAMDLYMTYTHKQLAVEWGCDERTVRTARVGLIKKGLCALVNDGKRQYLAPTSKGGCGSFRSADQSDPDHSDPGCGSFRSATADQNDPNALYIKKECIKRNVLRETEEGLKPQVASLPSPSAHDSDLAHSSAISSTREIQTQVQNPPFVSDPTALEALVDQLVAKRLAEASRSPVTTTGHSDTRTDAVRGNGGTEMEPTQGHEVAVSKPKAVRAIRPAKLGIEDEIPDKEKQIALSQLAEWLPTLQIKQEFRTEKLGNALQAFVIRRRERYLKRIKGFEEPLTRLGLQCQLTKAQKWGYDKCLESIWTAAGEGWKGFFEPRPTNQNGTLKSFKQQDEERAQESLKAWVEKKNAEVKH